MVSVVVGHTRMSHMNTGLADDGEKPALRLDENAALIGTVVSDSRRLSQINVMATSPGAVSLAGIFPNLPVGREGTPPLALTGLGAGRKRSPRPPPMACPLPAATPKRLLYG